MDTYKQLEDILNKEIENGWRPWNIRDVSFRYIPHQIKIRLQIQSKDIFDINIHDLFSKDSGLMEFVEWKITMSFGEGNLKVRYNEMSAMTAEEKILYFIQNIVA